MVTSTATGDAATPLFLTNKSSDKVIAPWKGVFLSGFFWGINSLVAFRGSVLN